MTHEHDLPEPPRIPAGTYRARAVSGALALTSKGREQFAVEFDLLDPEWVGTSITWYGYFGDEANRRGKTLTDSTFEALRVCGWSGDDLSEEPLPGLSTREVSLAIVVEEYKGVYSSKVRFINRPGSFGIKAPMPADKARAFAARLRARAIASRVAETTHGVKVPVTRTSAPQAAPQLNREPIVADDDGF